MGATDAVAGGAGVSEAMTVATVVEDAGAMAMEGAGTGAAEAVAEGGGAGVALAMVEGVTCLSNSRSNCAVCSAKSLCISTRKSSVEGFMVKAGRSIQIAWIPPQIDSRSRGFMERSLATVAHYRSMISIQPRDSGQALAYPA